MKNAGKWLLILGVVGLAADMYVQSSSYTSGGTGALDQVGNIWDKIQTSWPFPSKWEYYVLGVGGFLYWKGKI